MNELGIKEEEIKVSEEEILQTKVNMIEKFSEENGQGTKMIIIPFFIKLIQNLTQMQEREREELHFIKKSFYLLKKILFIWVTSLNFLLLPPKLTCLLFVQNNVMKHEYYKKEL